MNGRDRNSARRQGVPGAKVGLVQLVGSLSGSARSSEIVAQSLRRAGAEVHFFFGAEGPVVDRARTAGYPIQVVAHQNWLRKGRGMRWVTGWLRQRRACGHFARLFKAEDLGLIYINTIASAAAALAARRVGLPLIWHIRELFGDMGGEIEAPVGLGKGFVRWVIRQCSSEVIVVSECVARNVMGAASLPRLNVVPNAVSDDFFRPSRRADAARRNLGIPQGVPVIGVPGVLRRVKGHGFFLRSCRRILSGRPDCLFVFGGGGDPTYVKEIRGWIREQGLERSIRLVGWLGDMGDFYRACDVVCVPSASESFGRCVIEAFAARRPVVATSVGGIPEVIRDGETGLLVRFGDAKALAEKLLLVLTDAALRERMVQQAYASAEKDYSQPAHDRRLAPIVSGVLNQ